jgi:N6-adenosine-specific RNA methylase IME4
MTSGLKYRVLLADIPWRYRQKINMADGTERGADTQYATMSVAEAKTYTSRTMLNGLPIDEQLADDSVLFLWTTNPLLIDMSAPAVCIEWGFTPKQLITWVKGRLDLGVHPITTRTVPVLVPHMGMGFYTRGITEHMILATRGSMTDYVMNNGQTNLVIEPEVDLGPEDTVFIAGRTQHSRKPDAAYRLIERLFPGPRLELFARTRRAEWDQIGDQLI